MHCSCPKIEAKLSLIVHQNNAVLLALAAQAAQLTALGITTANILAGVESLLKAGKVTDLGIVVK